MAERQIELVVATAHDLLMDPSLGKRHRLRAPRQNRELDYDRIARASEDRVPRGAVRVALGDSGEYNVPLFEVTYTGLQKAKAISSLIGELGLNQVLVVSRLGGRFLHKTRRKVADRFGHPAQIIRDPKTGAAVAAQEIGVPQPSEYRGPNLAAVSRSRKLNGTLELRSYLPEDMFLLTRDGPVEVPNLDDAADVNYHYDPIGRTRRGVIISHSVPHHVYLPAAANDELQIVHSEVLLEGLRLGALSPEQAASMVVACGVERMPDNQQGNTFTSLAYFSESTLRDLYETIKF